MNEGFSYPAAIHERRHGPNGYKQYENFRDWLRDEFCFRCVYCLHREQWYGRATTFEIDHLQPVSVDSTGECRYSNLVYSCATCNSAKSNIVGFPDPCSVGYGTCLSINADGLVVAHNDQGRKHCSVLRMNSKTNLSDRRKMIGLITTLKTMNYELYEQLLGFPESLPDLRSPRRKVPNNTKPQGLESSYLVLRENGLLPKIYL